MQEEVAGQRAQLVPVALVTRKVNAKGLRAHRPIALPTVWCSCALVVLSSEGDVSDN